MKLPILYPRVLLDPQETDANPGGESSTSSAVTETEGTSATPSDDKEPKTLSEVVEAAAKKSTEESSTPVEETKVEEKPLGENEERPEGETETEEEVVETEEAKTKRLAEESRLDKNPRFKEVLKERDDARAESAQLKVKAEQAEALTKFCVDNRIADKDLIGALELTALSKNNPAEFRKRIGTIVEEYDVAMGQRIPPDLAKEVEEGTLSEARAKELAQARLRNGRTEQQLHEERQQSARDHDNQIQNGLNAWTASQTTSDPGFKGRYEQLVEAVHFDWQRTPPQTLQDAIVLVEKANKRVKDRVASRLPKSTNKVLTSRNGSSPNHGEDLKLDNLTTDLQHLVTTVANRKR
jgi:hypothetical protein